MPPLSGLSETPWSATDPRHVCGRRKRPRAEFAAVPVRELNKAVPVAVAPRCLEIQSPERPLTYSGPILLEKGHSHGCRWDCWRHAGGDPAGRPGNPGRAPLPGPGAGTNSGQCPAGALGQERRRAERRGAPGITVHAARRVQEQPIAVVSPQHGA
eukprot:ctg_609.g281